MRLRAALLVIAGFAGSGAIGCAGTSRVVRFAAPGTWEFQATGPSPADFVLRVTITRPRGGRQTARVAGIVAGGNVFRIQADGEGATDEIAAVAIVPGEHLPLRFAWRVEAQTPDGTHIPAAVTVAIPRLQAGTDPLDPLSPGWEDFLDQAAAGEVRLGGRIVVLEGIPPLREDALTDDPGGAPLPPASLTPEAPARDG